MGIVLLSINAIRRGTVPNSLKHDMQDDFTCDTCGYTENCLEDLKMHKRGNAWKRRSMDLRLYTSLFSLLKTIPENFYVHSTQPFCFHHMYLPALALTSLKS